MRIGISGYARTGKDEVAKVFEEYGFVRIGMSDALNNYLCILNPLLNVSRDVMRYADAIKAFGYVEAKAQIPEVRRLLQVFGTEVGRAIDPDMWVKELVKLTEKHEDSVTTGIRFPNERDAMDVLIHVTRPGFAPLNNHPSEDLSGIAQFAHHSIHNDGSIDLLHMKAMYLYQKIKGDR